MVLANGASAPVRPTPEIPSGNGVATETAKPDFELALDEALAALPAVAGPRTHAAALAHARCEILAAADAALKAEKRKLVAALTPVQLRKEVRELLDAHEALLDFIDDLERQPAIARELRRRRCRGEISLAAVMGDPRGKLFVSNKFKTLGRSAAWRVRRMS
jgi:hypothetical protein